MQKSENWKIDSLRAHLDHEPVPLKFGTSGRRGCVVDLTQLEVYLNALAELEYLQSLPVEQGGISKGDVFYYAYDLRPSSTAFVREEKGRGELAQAIERAIRDAGMVPVNLGPIPTPALTYYGLVHAKGSIMITGSHIPFERNGYKLNTSQGELLKKDEEPIGARVDELRRKLYQEPLSRSLFNENGMLKTGHQELSPVNDGGRRAYIARYLDFFRGRDLTGLRLVAYQHSAVGRDILVEVLRALGAEVVPAGRSDMFVPIDTENIDAEQLRKICLLVAEAALEYGPIEAVVSTDGDSDRPLVLGVDSRPAGPEVRFFGGDLVGMVVAEFLKVDSVVVPISCNDAVDLGNLRHLLEPKTRIGSPFVIAGMQRARAKGKQRICGWEANGGFLLGSDIEHEERVLRALPTRDALLPILSVLFAAKAKGIDLAGLFRQLPARFSQAALLRKFPRARALQIVGRLTPSNPRVNEVRFEDNGVRLLDCEGREIPDPAHGGDSLTAIRSEVSSSFPATLGFDAVVRMNYTDGVRIYFANGEIAHVRPSGNADEFRIYAVAGSQARADEIARLGVGEPDGILRRMERQLVAC
ncbi:MAG: phosphomannomutase [Acidobacteriota bacterium]